MIQSFIKKYRKENIFCRWKKAITPIIMGGFYPKLNLTSTFMIIHLCIKYESNTLMFSKDIKQKLVFNVEKVP